MPSMEPTMYVISGLHGGGAERLLTNIVLRQAARKDKILVVTLLPGGVFRQTLEDAGVEVIDLGMRHDGHAPIGALRLAALIRRRRPAVVHAWMHHAALLAFAALVLAGRRKSARLFWGLFCSDLGAVPWQFRIVLALTRLASRHVEAVIYNAPEAREFHRRIGYRERRSVVISNWVDPEIFRHDAGERGVLRTELGIDAESVVVAIVARVDPEKDWSGMLEAVRGLPGVVTVAVGKGTEQLAPQPGLVALGWRDDVVRILSAADIFLLGSSWGEGASLAVSEAMSCGLPCIV
ncbi:MAG TPA: glycosyltransferase, partial [Thermoanaerobaculia bacterium]|nr:glycosyltransferase [Thermoanaerobaculia bacterium]